MELLIIILLVFLIAYWLDSIRAKENATQYAKDSCKKSLLEFLDDTVSIKKVRLLRNVNGQLSIYREYQFEFSSTGKFRYKGCVRLLGHQLIGVEMEPYHFHDTE